MHLTPDSSPTTNRPPTLPFPTLHLGSFDSLSLDAFPDPASPSRVSTGFVVESSLSSSPTRAGFARDTRIDAGPSRQARLPLDDRPGLEVDQRPSSRGQNNTSTTRLNYSPSRARAPDKSRLNTPSLSLPPLPASLKSSLPSHEMFAFDAPGSAALPLTTRTYSSSSGRSRIQMPSRPLGPSLTIHIPPLTPSSSTERQLDRASPVLRDSPGIPRRRTIIEANPAVSRAPSARTADVLGTMTPPRDESPKRSDGQQVSPSPVRHGSLIMPIARPTPSLDASAISSSPRRLERRPSQEDLKKASPISPTTKRSLPRPPSNRTSGPTTESVPNPSTQPPRALPPTAPMSSNLPQPPAASSTWPPPNAPRGSFGALTPTAKANGPLPMPPRLQPEVATPRHQPTNSASTLPVIAGLADSGPYAVTSAVTPRATQATVGVGRPVTAKSKPTPGEEVCLECMMRDRDLADVDVQGPGVWDRSSDVGWDELKWREAALVKSMGDGSVKSTHTPSLDHSEETDFESTSASPQSTAFSLEEPELRRRTVAKQQRDLSRTRRKETDHRIVKEVGWRGFKWEEGPKGEGLPRGFRGRHGGRLTEDGIKAVLTKFPSASQHRYNTLLTYLQQQSTLVLEIQAEAKRLGHYPEPGDVPIPEGTNSRRDGPAVAGPRTTSIAWEAKHARELSEHMRGVFSSPAQDAPLSVVRPSPSSPANLANLTNASTPRAVPSTFNRPLTHFYPDREPAPIQRSRNLKGSPPRTRYVNGMGASGILDRSLSRDDLADAEEDLWSPISPEESGLRPFSFAVRAGAVTARDGSDAGHGRRSLWGRWGGSVTSLFGGSQGGSGSMVDMHVGLDDERRNNGADAQIPSHPRAVSMATPSRPSFFGRNSGASSAASREAHQREGRVSKSISVSRLSQVLKSETEDEPAPAKKSGFKGFFRKMKKERKSSTSKSNPQSVRVDDSVSDLGTPLAPPPPISYLVGRGDGQTTRDRSGSSSSMLISSPSSTPGPKRNSTGPGIMPYSMRSVSAPLGGSSSGGSPSTSPTSSRYATTGAGRESYATAQNRDRRASGVLGDFAVEGLDRRGPKVEVLSYSRALRASPEPANFDETTLPRGAQAPMDISLWTPPAAAYARPHAASKTASTLSSSSYIETPPANSSNLPFFAHNQSSTQTTIPASANLSPNRFKTLPPLPPPGQEGARNANFATSPDSFIATFSDQVDFPVGSGYASSASERLHAPSAGYTNAKSYQSANSSPRGFDARYRQPQPQHQIAQPRASYDLLADRPRVRTGESMSPRMAQSMYVQPTAADSTGSFAPFGGKGQMQMSNGNDTDERSVRGKRGFKGLFSKAGRVV